MVSHIMVWFDGLGYDMFTFVVYVVLWCADTLRHVMATCAAMLRHAILSYSTIYILLCYVVLRHVVL